MSGPLFDPFPTPTYICQCPRWRMSSKPVVKCSATDSSTTRCRFYEGKRFPVSRIAEQVLWNWVGCRSERLLPTHSCFLQSQNIIQRIWYIWPCMDSFWPCQALLSFGLRTPKRKTQTERPWLPSGGECTWLPHVAFRT